MQAGDLDRLIAFGAKSETSDEYGASQTTFVEQFRRRANVKPKLGGETVLQGRIEGQVLVNITVRKDPETNTITPAWLAQDVATGQQYDVKSVIDPFEHTAERDFWVEVLAQSGVQVS